jgi:PPE family
MGANFNYDDTSHQVIFDHLNDGAGSDALQEASRAWQRLGNDIGVTSKSYAQSAIRGVLAAREGAAAVAAIGAMVPWMDDVKVIATSAAKRAQGQAEHWVAAKNSVPPVPPAPHSALTHHR